MSAFRTRLACCAYVVLLVLAAIGIDRAIANRLFERPSDFVPAYRAFQEYTSGVKLDQLRGNSSHFDALFLGNSRTMFGVNPAIVDAQLALGGLHIRSYNLAMPKVDVRFWPGFFHRYYTGRNPRYVLLGIVPDDMDARTALLQRIALFYQSSGFANRHMSSISRWAEERLAHLFVLRGRIADVRLLSLYDALHGRKLNLREIHVSNSQGWTRLEPQFMESRSLLASRRDAALARGDHVRFELGSGQLRSVLALNQWVRKRGGCVILFTDPLFYDGVGFIRKGFSAGMRKLAAADPTIQFLDVGGQVEGQLGLADFGDSDHLTPPGASIFSTVLSRKLAGAMRSSACTAGKSP